MNPALDWPNALQHLLAPVATFAPCSLRSCDTSAPSFSYPLEQVGSAYAVDGAGRRISIAEAAVTSSPILNPKAAAAAVAAAAAAARGEQGSAAAGIGQEEEPEAGPGPAAGSAAALAAARERARPRAEATVEGTAAEGQPEDATGAVRVRLSDPDGFLLSNDVISDVFAAFDLPSSWLSDNEEGAEGGSSSDTQAGVERKPVAA